MTQPHSPGRNNNNNNSTLLSTLLLTILLLPLSTTGLKFDLHAYPANQRQKSERCIRNFVAKDTLVVVTATVGGTKGDGQEVGMHVCFFPKKNPPLLVLLCLEFPLLLIK